MEMLVFDGPGKPLRKQAFLPPVPGPEELLVRVRLCTLCGSDFHTLQGRRATPTPTVLGHEILGEVEHLPQGVTVLDRRGRPLHPGDRIAWAVAASCGQCFSCTHNLPQKCENLFKYGHESLKPTYGPSGGLATHCHLVPGSAIYLVPKALPDEVAAPASCATATVVAALRNVGIVAGASVLILGAGMLGLTASALARSQGAEAVLVHDVDEARCRRALDFGATSILDGQDLLESVRAHTAGRGADVVLELSGSSQAIQTSLRAARVGGRVAWLGAVFPTPEIPIRPEDFIRRHLTLQGIHNYHPDDLGSALTFLENHHLEYPFASLVERIFPIDAIESAIRFVEHQRPVRIGIRP